MIPEEKFKVLKNMILIDVGKRDSILETIEKNQAKIERLGERKLAIEKAREIIQLIARETQSNLESHVSSTVTLALKSVDDYYPEFAMEFVTRRNQPECDLFFVQKGVQMDPMETSGGGPKDIASFILRIIVGLLKGLRPVFIFDEPFAHVSPDKQEKVSEMVKMICDELNIQILMVSHAEDINVKADRTFINKQVDGISQMEEI